MRGEVYGSKDLGRAEITPEKVHAGENILVTIKYHVGSIPVVKGGTIRFEVPYGYTAPQPMFPGKPGYFRVKTEDPSQAFSVRLFDTKVRRASGSEYWRIDGRDDVFKVSYIGMHIFAELVDGELHQGDCVTAVFGAGAWPPGVFTVYAQEFMGKSTFFVAVDADGSRQAPYSGYYLVPGPPVIEVTAGEVEKTKVFVPSVIRDTGRFDIRVSPKDRFGNHSYVHNAQVATAVSGSRITLDANDNDDAEINPNIVDTDFPWNIYWGDLHAHSIHSDGLGSAEDYFRYAIEASCLDFASISDHTVHFSGDEWDIMVEATEKYNNPGTFATLFGYEDNSGSDRNVYYKTPQSPIWTKDLFHYGRPGVPFKDILPAIRRTGGLIIHHQHSGPLYEEDYDPEITRLVEVYSCLGASEYAGNPRPVSTADWEGRSYVDYLKKGWKLGVCGASDDHAGHPGELNWLRTAKRYHNGLHAVLAEELTREAIFDACFKRRTYATTGERIIVDFRIDGHFMGEEITAENEKITVFIRILGTSELDDIVLVKNGSSHRTFTPGNDTLVEEVTEARPKTGEDFYYLRIVQEDGNMAWSSPIWVR